ncbi:ribonuclease Z [Jeotgalibacillus haloalkalitolerans]|uniref:Ribonuclease Z n=1 Tax=Jeotgalibacillus haloalkalitolerans TaxID=3104292 RepID=A0ABU5KLD9_9BACL|nr:ribonuclease Z [Jeotgalibacillus sp. HH7-29]MDZ5712085.1 ribonuclease Z [Jeotgalibacillus sp. HH7-29]
MRLHFLGTGAGVPGKERNVSSLALKEVNKHGDIWLFDCGEATQHQILHTSIKPRRIKKVFITHLHGDHIFGLPGFLGSRSFQGGTEPLTVYGPAGIREYISTALKLSRTYLKYDLEIIEISEGTSIDDTDFIISVRKLDHVIPSYGYRIDEKDRPGKLNSEKLQQLGIRPGPVYKQLKNGETIEWEGSMINGKDFIEPPVKGKTIAIAGDTRKCNAVIDLAKGADLLIHEATFGSENEKMAYDYYHSTSVQAAEIAVSAGVKSLWLTHISARYAEGKEKELLNQAREIFPNSFIASDLLEEEL